MLCNSYYGIKIVLKYLCWVWGKFKFSDVDNTGELDKKELKRFFKSINYEVKENEFNVKWDEYARDARGRCTTLNWSKFKEMYGTMLIPKYIKARIIYYTGVRSLGCTIRV